jgi:plastocyanin
MSAVFAGFENARVHEAVKEGDREFYGGFESEEAARAGWENGEGAVQEGQSYVRTFETAGEHACFCVPHEAAGMEGTIVVEE